MSNLLINSSTVRMANVTELCLSVIPIKDDAPAEMCAIIHQIAIPRGATLTQLRDVVSRAGILVDDDNLAGIAGLAKVISDNPTQLYALNAQLPAGPGLLNIEQKIKLPRKCDEVHYPRGSAGGKEIERTLQVLRSDKEFADLPLARQVIKAKEFIANVRAQLEAERAAKEAEKNKLARDTSPNPADPAAATSAQQVDGDNGMSQKQKQQLREYRNGAEEVDGMTKMD